MKLFIVLLALVASVAAVAEQEYVDGEFFISLKDNVDIDAFSAALSKYNVELVRSFKRFNMVFVKGEVDDVIRASQNPDVAFWERNLMAYTQQCSSGSASGCWGLDRIDQTGQLGYTNPTNPGAVYEWGTDDGAGVYAYVVDTGILTSHEDFGNRAIWGFTAPGLGGNDGNGHGTHCAGSAGGTTTGVAKRVTLVAVQVMNALGSGTTSDIVAGLEYVLDNHNARGSSAKSVINLSLGSSGINNAMDTALNSLINGGVTCPVAAGNSDADACNSSPGHVANAITVGASDIEDVSASFTNWGTCLDLFAPGVNIRSAWNDGGYNTISGTSMATPHVCGAVARYMSSVASPPSPSTVANYITGQATRGALSFRVGHGTSPNLLLRTNCPM